MQQILEHDELSPAQSITITAGQVSSGDSSTQLIGTSDGRLFRLEDDTLTHVVWPVSELLVMTGIRFMRRLENQNLAIATNEQGILLVSPQGEIVQRIDQLRGLESQTVHHLIEDQEYGLRAGTDFGVSRIDLQTPYTLFFRRDGLERSFINCFTRHEGRLHIGMDRGAYFLQPAQISRGWNARFAPLPELEAQVRSLLSTDQGLLIGTNEGLWWTPSNLNTPVKLTTKPLQGLKLRAPTQDDPITRFWWWNRDRIGTGHWNGSQWVFDPSTLTLPDSITGFTQGYPGRVLVSLADGTVGWVRFVPGTEPTWHSIPVTVSNPQDIHLVDARDGATWLTSRAGIMRLSEEAQWNLDPNLDFREYPDDLIWPIHPFDDGTIWYQIEPRVRAESEWHERLIRRRHSSSTEPDILGVPRAITEVIGYGGARIIFSESEVDKNVLWVAGATGLLRLSLIHI